jgi:hypothetical protein
MIQRFVVSLVAISIQYVLTSILAHQVLGVIVLVRDMSPYVYAPIHQGLGVSIVSEGHQLYVLLILSAGVYTGKQLTF